MQEEQQQEQVMQMQQQQHNNNNMNMNMNNMMSSSASSNYYANNTNNLTTHHIQQYLDENKSLILKIVESQNSGKLSECAENQVRLQRNLMYLAAIADSQPQPAIHSQAQQQQAAARSSSSMLYTQQQYSALQQQQAMNSHLGMSGTHFLHSEPNQQQLCPDLMTPGKQDMDARLGRTSSADDN